ncbi:MAG: hypothetical protein ACYCWA_02500 [Thiobacillus sp.]
MMERLRALFVHALLFVLTVLSVGMPATATAGTSRYEWTASAPSGLAAGTWAEHASSVLNWVNFAGTTTPVPRDNWKNLGQAVWDESGGYDLNMIHGERWITLARADAGGLGLSSREISDRMERFPANSAYVFAAYSPENAELRVEIHRIEKRPDGNIYIDQADFTPWHGEKWKAAGKYRTAAEEGFGMAGYNPFENFKGSSVTDNVFHNIGWSGAQVVIGHAMRHYGAIVGFIAASKARTTQDVKTKGGLFKKTVTVTVKGWVKPDWYVATPVEMQQEGAMTAAICVTATATPAETTSCDDPAHVAISGVSITQWKGGNMPMDEEMVYQWTQKKSSFTVFFFAIILAVLTWGVALAILGPSGTVLGGAMGGSGIGAGSLGVIAGVGYAIASTALHSGGGLFQAQSGMFGSTGNGVLRLDLASLSQQSRGLAKGIHNRHIQSAQGYNLTSSQKLFKGACPEDKTVAECWGLSLDAGQMWRGDSYGEVNMTLEMRARYDECKGLGYTGAELMKCAAPNSTAWPAAR